MAGVAGFEPAPKVLETSMLTIDTIPLCVSKEWRDESHVNRLTTLYSLLATLNSLLILFMQRMAATAATELFEFEPVRLRFLVLGRHVIALFALSTLQNNIISRHFFGPLSFVLCP